MRQVFRRWANLPLRAKGLVVVALPVAGLLTATVFGQSLQQRTNEEQEAVRHIGRVRAQIRTVLTLVLDAETGVRGYALSEDETYLTPYSAAFDRLPVALARLEDLVGEDSDQLARAQRVRALVGRNLEVLAQVRSQASDPGEIEGLDEGNQLMGQMRAELVAMERDEEERLQERLDALAGAERAQEGIFIGAVLFGLAGGIFAMVLFTTGIARRVEVISKNAALLAEGRPLEAAPGGEDEVGRLAAALGAASDLLADRERRLRSAKEKAEAANWAKSEFLTMTSHELRTPLTAVAGFAKFLSKQDLDERHQEAVGYIVRAAEHLAGVINDILDIARIEAGEMSLSLREVSVDATVEEAVSFLQGIAEERDVTIVNEVGEGASALADERGLRQVLINLISNAIKYNRVSGKVVVSSEQEEGGVRIAVTDEGVGIAPEDLDRLFVAYDRLGADETAIKGVGLGLTISKSLAELMNGRLEVRSKVGEGTTFILTVPVAEGGTQDRKPPGGAVEAEAS